MTAAERELARLDGNRIWRVDTAEGPVLQKLYAERGGWLHAWGRELTSRLRGGKTSTRAAGRRATERELLTLWKQHGCDVPAELSARHPELANARTLVLECIDGPLLSRLLADPALPAARRAALVERFGADLARRHRRALELGEARLVHEHGGVAHVLVSVPASPAASAGVAALPVDALRFVSFDLENAFTPRRDLQPLLAKELASCLRSLAHGRDAGSAEVRQDVLAFVRGYGERARLAAAVEHYLRHPSPFWRLVWALDRRREERRGKRGGKYALLALLDETLRASA